MGLEAFITIWRKRFLISGTVFTVLVCGLVLLAKYELNAGETTKNFEKIKQNSVRMRDATAGLKQSLGAYHGLLPHEYEKKTVDALLYNRVDDINEIFPASILTVSPKSDQPEVSTIPFTIKMVDTNYVDFLSGLSKLQSKSFPHVVTNTISIISNNETKGAVVYTIEGTIITPSKGDGAVTK